MKSGLLKGKSFTAFVDGLPPDHECNSTGDKVYETKSGKRITWNTIQKWAPLTTMAREPLLYEYFAEIEDPILMESVSCSICKEVAFDNACWL